MSCYAALCYKLYLRFAKSCDSRVLLGCFVLTIICRAMYAALRYKLYTWYCVLLKAVLRCAVVLHIGMWQVEKLSMHAYGCRVIQRILEHCIDDQKQVILEEIKDSFSVLIQVQWVTHWWPLNKRGGVCCQA